MHWNNKQTIQVGGWWAWIVSWTFQVDFWNNTTNIYTQEVIVAETDIITNSKPVVQYYDSNSRDADESEFDKLDQEEQEEKRKELEKELEETLKGAEEIKKELKSL